MINRGLFTVYKMHIKQQLLSKAFVVATLLMPVVMFGIIIIQAALMNISGAEKSQIYITSDDQSLLDSIEAQLQTRAEVSKGIYRIEYQYVSNPAFEVFLGSKRPEILANSNNGLFFIPGQALDDKAVRFYSTNLGNQILRQSMSEVFNRVLNRTHFSSLGVPAADLEFAVENINIKGFNVTEHGQEQGSVGNTAVGFGMAFLLMFSIVGIVMPFSAAIIEEKTNRAVEVLLTSVNPAQLLAGKIMARVTTGVAQMLVWLLPLFVFVLFPALMVLPPQFQIDLGPGIFLFFFANYVLGLCMLLAIWGGFAAMFDSTQDANQAMWPISMLMFVPFYAVFAVIRNPANSVAEILSMTPLTSLYVMPVRLATLAVPLWQPLVALAANGMLVWLAIKAGGKIYRISILATGQQPSLRQVFLWLRQP